MLIDQRYEVISPLGDGNVFKVKDKVTRATRALKLCRSEDPDEIVEFKDEFFTLTGLTHPDIVKVHDFKRLPTMQYFTMEYVEGEDIFDHFSKARGDYDSLYRVIGSVLETLDYVHKRGLVHGDIKPQHIIVSGTRAKLVDFGLSRTAGISGSSVGGTLAYIAPELVKGGKIDPRVDLYSLGVVLYETLRGKKIESLDERIVGLDESVPKPLRSIVSKLTKQDADRRYASAQEVWKDLQEHLPRSQLRFAPTLLRSRLVAREGELATLRELYAGPPGRGKMVFLLGERGIGKSRLLRETAHWLQMEQAFVARLSCPEGDAAPMELLKRIFRECGVNVEEELVSARGAPARNAQLQVFETLARRLRRVAEERNPLVLLIDEFDRADRLSLEFFRYLAPELERTPLLLVAAVESGSSLSTLREETGDSDLVLDIALARLNLDDVRTVVGSILSSDSADSIADWIYEKVGGNPLHVETTLERLVRTGHAKRSRSTWVLDRKGAERLKPSDSLASVVEGFIESCDPRSLELLQVASVIGNRFSGELLELLSGFEQHEYYTLFLKLRYSDVVRSAGRGEYGFSHGWMRDLLYGKLGLSKKRALHRRLLKLLKERGGAAEVLFHHALRCGANREAYENGMKAAEEAEKHCAQQEALQHYRTVVDLRRKLRKGKDPSLHEKLGDLEHLTGEYDRALRDYGLVLSLSPEANVVQLKMGKVYRDRGDYSKAIEFFRRVSSSSAPESLAALSQLAWVYLQMNETDKARETALKARKSAEGEGDERALSESYHNLAQISQRQTDSSAAVEYFGKCIEIKKRLNDEHGIGLALNNLGILHWGRGQLAEAERCFTDSLGLMEKVGDVRTVALLHNNLGIVYRARAEWERALEHYEESFRLHRKLGEKRSLAALYNNLAVVYRHRGKWRKAVEFCHQSLRLSEGLKMDGERSTALRNLGSIYLDMGISREAHDFLRRSLDVSEEATDPHGRLLSLMEIARCWTEEGEYSEALSVFRESEERLTETMTQGEKSRFFALQAAACLGAGKLGAARARLSEASKLAEGSLDPEDSAAIERLKGRYHFLKGDLTTGSACFGKASATYRRLGSEFELGATLLELARSSLSSWRSAEDAVDVHEIIAGLKEAEEIFDRLQMEKRLSEAHRVCVEALDMVSSTLLPAYSRTTQLETLYEISKLVNSILDMNLLFDSTMDLVIQLLKAERGVLLLLNRETGELEVASGRGMDRDTIEDVTELSNSIIARVTKKGEPVISSDALSDSRFSRRKSVILQRIRSLLCVPLKTNENVLGTIYVDSRLSDNVFREGDKEFLSALANLIAVAIERSSLHEKLERDTVSWKREVVRRYTFEDLVGRSPKMQEVYDLIEKVCQTASTVLLTGESGTGKDLVAKAIHLLSPRKDGPLVEVACGSIPENLFESELFGHAKGAFTGATKEKKGLFEEANGGTIFLNEVGDAPLVVQTKLLRVLETGELRRVGETHTRRVDVRVICATNKDLKREIRRGGFREDLFYRLNVLQIDLPPLRERRGDIPLLAEHYVKILAKTMKKDITGFSKEAMDFFCRYDWPGNVRQLENCIEKACAISEGGLITLPELRLDEESQEIEGRFKEEKRRFEMNSVLYALQKHGGNRTRAADYLGIHRQQLQRYIKKYEITEDFQSAKLTATH